MDHHENVRMRNSATLLHRLSLWAHDQPESPAHRFRNPKKDAQQGWTAITAYAFWYQVVRTALYLQAEGLERGDRVLIYASNSPEWVQWELGTVLAGGVSVGVHPNISESELGSMLTESEPKWILAESDHFVDQIRAVATTLKSELGKVMSFANGAEAIVKSVAEQDGGISRSAEKLLAGLEPNEPQFIVYTSGTTGKPKGVLLSIQQLTLASDVLAREWNLPYMEGSLFSFLPLAHVAEKIQTISVAISMRYPVWFNSQYDQFLSELKEARPTILLAVPRVWEKIRDAVEQHKPKMLQRVKDLQFIGEVAEKLYLAQIREQLGMDQLKLAVSGAAKLSPIVAEWFTSIGIEIQEIYGMSETTGLISMTHPKKKDHESVGRPVASMEVMISPEGEIWVKGPLVFLGYFRDESATQEVMVRDSWLKTGDLGELREGDLYLLGRNREIIKLSNGRMIAPVPIENALQAIPEVSNACVLGEGTSHLTALVTLKESVLMDIRFVPGAIEGLTVEDEALKKKVQAAIQELQDSGKLAYPVHRVILLSREFSQEKGELTPTQKLNRRRVHENFKDFLEFFYS